MTIKPPRFDIFDKISQHFDFQLESVFANDSFYLL